MTPMVHALLLIRERNSFGRLDDTGNISAWWWMNILAGQPILVVKRLCLLFCFRHRMTKQFEIDTDPCQLCWGDYTSPSGTAVHDDSGFFSSLLVSAYAGNQDGPNHHHHCISHPHSVRRQVAIFGLLETENEQRIISQQGWKETQSKG